MKKKIVMTAGGSGGHVVPASVLAKALEKDYDILFFTDRRGMRYRQFIPSSAHVISIPCSALGGQSKLGKILALLWTLVGVIKSFILFLYYKPSGVVGFAGYGSFPASVAAGLLRKPLILHEQNTILGKTNRIIANWATVIAKSFQRTQRIPTHIRSVFTGLPLRQEITQLSPKYPTIDKQIKILITGGSQGARFLNQFAEIFASLPKEIKDKLRITQQVVDQKQAEHVKKLYQQSGITANILPFIEDMPTQIQNCHLFIGSAGSMILEVQMLKRPMILIPLRIAADNHQETNARALEATGGAKVVLEKEFNKKDFYRLVYSLLESPTQLKKMHESLKPQDGTANLVKLVKEIIK